MKKKENTILLIYGEGGHKSEMDRLLWHLCSYCPKNRFISICENGACLENKYILDSYNAPTIRNKYSKTKTVNSITSLFKILSLLFYIKKRYNIKVILSTGPGISILPSYFFKLFKAKLIYIETDCRFTTKSFTGRLLYPIADIFYVPNKSLLQLYPKSEYCGRL